MKSFEIWCEALFLDEKTSISQNSKIFKSWTFFNFLSWSKTSGTPGCLCKPGWVLSTLPSFKKINFFYIEKKFGMRWTKTKSWIEDFKLKKSNQAHFKVSAVFRNLWKVKAKALKISKTALNWRQKFIFAKFWKIDEEECFAPFSLLNSDRKTKDINSESIFAFEFSSLNYFKALSQCVIFLIRFKNVQIFWKNLKHLIFSQSFRIIICKIKSALKNNADSCRFENLWTPWLLKQTRMGASALFLFAEFFQKECKSFQK